MACRARIGTERFPDSEGDEDHRQDVPPCGQLLAVASSPNPDDPDEPFRAFITVSRKNRSEIKSIICELTPEQYEDLFDDESE